VSDSEAADEDPVPEPEVPSEGPSRAAPTDLQGDIKRVTDAYVMGDPELMARLDGKALTPSRIATEVQRLRGSEKPPSTGAVAAAFKRWEEYGFATFQPKPYAFADYTDQGRSIGLKGILAERRAARSASAPDAESEGGEASPEVDPDEGDS
jgi:hypothetical protein